MESKASGSANGLVREIGATLNSSRGLLQVRKYFENKGGGINASSSSVYYCKGSCPRRTE